MEVKLHSYQEICKNHIINNKKVGLFLPCGGGKTLATLEALKELGLKTPTLIIAPINIARITWEEEITKWGYDFEVVSFVVNKNDKRLSKAKREELYKTVREDDNKIYIINQDLIVSLINYFKPYFPFKNVIIDELQGFKSSSSKRFKALKSVFYSIDRFIGLTGTPMPKSLGDIWSEIALMDNGQRLGHTMTAFRREYFYEGRKINNVVVDWIPRPNAKEEIYAKIKDIVISIKNTNLKLPERIDKVHTIKMPKDAKKFYNTLIKDKIVPITQDKSILIKNAGALTAKLSQIASGALYLNDASEKREYAIIHEEKLSMTKYIIDNSDGNVIICYWFKTDLDMLTKFFKENDMEFSVFDKTNKMKRDWSNKKIPILLINPASAGHGLNLQDGGSTLIWYTIPWSTEHFIQANARVYRQGQKNTTYIHYLVMDKTIDTKKMKILREKMQNQDELIDALKADHMDLVSVLEECVKDVDNE